MRVERQGGRGPADEERREDGGQRLSGLDARRQPEPGAWDGRRRRRAAQRVGEVAGRRPPGRVGRQRAVDEAQEPLRQVGAELTERSSAGLDRARGLEHRATPERMPSRERLPEHHADRPDVGRRRRLAAGEPLGRDVRERSRHVSRLGECLGVGHLREPEVEHARRDMVVVGQEDVRGLDVAMQDPGRMCMRKAVAHLRAGLDRVVVGQLSGAQRLAVRLARDELVRDVDVPRVAAEPVRAQAGGMAQVRGRLGLALGPHGRLALPRDDLQRDVEARPLVAGEPDRARAAAAERPQGPVAVEDELDAGERRGSLSHA